MYTLSSALWLFFRRLCASLCSNYSWTIVDGTPTVMYSNLRREHVPNVSDYVAGTVRLMTIPDNVDDFPTHFRVSRKLCKWKRYKEDCCNRISTKQTVTPEKQLLVFLWYISNMSSMGEVKHVLKLSKSTVHCIIKDVSSAIVELSNRIIRIVLYSDATLSILVFLRTRTIPYWNSFSMNMVIAKTAYDFCLFDMILYIPSTILQ